MVTLFPMGIHTQCIMHPASEVSSICGSSVLDAWKGLARGTDRSGPQLKRWDLLFIGGLLLGVRAVADEARLAVSQGHWDTTSAAAYTHRGWSKGME